jgi:methylenetetrahydrofolate reductase (NADPH)
MVELSGVKISDYISKKFESAGDDLVEIKKIGVDIATELGSKLLAAKVPGLHFYTMNTAESTLVIAKNLGLVK